MQIANDMSCLPTKYRQSGTAIDFEKIVLTVTLLYFWLPMLSTQVADLSVPELSYQAYQNLN